jgi:tRNA pseudouridine55 synthase
VYEASIAFGAQTATDDCTGAIVRVAPVPSAVDVDHAIIRLTGTIDQRPPDYSAKKIQGVRAYAAARSGAPLVLDPVIVTVHSWRIRNRSPDAIHVTISCSAGTYVRALARDLGLMAGSAAHLTGLRRVQSGGFHVRDAIDLETIRAARPALRSALAAVPQLPTQTLTPHELRDVEHGRAVEARVGGELVALVDDRTALAAIARREAGMLKPKLVLRDA